MNSLFTEKNRSSFYKWCALYYLALFGYFYLLHSFFNGAFGSEWGIEKVLMGGIILIITTALAPRIDFLWINYRVHRMLFGHQTYNVLSRSKFYATSCAYYIILITGIIFYIYFNSRINFIVFYYVMFLWGTLLLTFKDFLFPSFNRYQDLIEKRKWGLFRDI